MLPSHYEKDRKIFYAEMEREKKPDFLQMLNDVIQENYKLKNKNLSPSNVEIKAKENEIEPD